MHLKSFLFALTLTAGLLVGPTVFAQHPHQSAPSKPGEKTGRLIKVTEKDATWARKERGSYPLDVCVSSDEKLGSMGKPPEYIYRVDGKPDQLVVFCCAGCEDDFQKDPAKHLAKIDAARSGKSGGAAGKAAPKGQR
jgi:hypothetical protein